jgi:hypothetical protein
MADGVTPPPTPGGGGSSGGKLLPEFFRDSQEARALAALGVSVDVLGPWVGPDEGGDELPESEPPGEGSDDAG